MSEQAACNTETLEKTLDPNLILKQFYKAFNTKDINLIAENWSHSNSISMFNPSGDLKVGWKEIKTLYEHIFNLPLTYQLKILHFDIQESSEMFVASGDVQGSITNEDLDISFQVRSTRVFMLECGEWKQIHYHGSIINAGNLAHYENIILG